MNKSTPRWTQSALDALQVEEHIAGYHLSFRQQWFQDFQGTGLIQDTLLMAQVRCVNGIEADSGKLLRNLKAAFINRMNPD